MRPSAGAPVFFLVHCAHDDIQVVTQGISHFQDREIVGVCAKGALQLGPNLLRTQSESMEVTTGRAHEQTSGYRLSQKFQHFGNQTHTGIGQPRLPKRRWGGRSWGNGTGEMGREGERGSETSAK